MSHFAKVENGIVTQVLVIEQDVIDSGLFGTGWVQTSYNTRAGIYYVAGTDEVSPDQSKAFRKNYAGIGYSYDPTRDAFINPKPVVPPEDEQYVTFDEFACLWLYNPPEEN